MAARTGGTVDDGEADESWAAETEVHRTGAPLVRSARAALASVEQLAGGLGTALLGLALLLWLVVAATLSLVGVGLPLLPPALRALHALTHRERARLNRWGPEVLSPPRPPSRLRLAVTDLTVRRELRWLAIHASRGLLLGLAGVLLPLAALRDLTFPLWWRLVPEEANSTSVGLGTADSWPDAVPVALLGLGWLAILLGLGPAMARHQAGPGRRLLNGGADLDLALRIAQLTATRAAALDAHAAELRRIERALHDGTQNRLVSVTVLVGAARRMVTRDPGGGPPPDPSTVAELLERAQTAAEQALAELRTVARGIVPPVLTDRGLAGALSGLAADCPVPCRIEVDVPTRCAASVEATAYFVVAEALTNIARHSGAANATVAVRSRDDRLFLTVTDDGRGGADEDGGSGLTGIRRRVAAHDGRLRLASPAGGPTILEVELPCGS
ncbi:sensor domain-containing protein [Streptomyces sp. DSM 44915]|uniref:histidine kinase n=1 Tax=Streptomyces chisholmiae TaxID=3075540 RepID=A0ABU2JXF6_9ACTN|nr:sensor domain-containing protein [Streptomyces sp. DSM 44915]MDT0269682.1 sensor domain-containing protein [Streptomyces sp. DSM 44915]